MKLIQDIMTNNPCYKAGRKITVKGLMLHSVGCPQPSAAVFIKSWNTPSYEIGVHAIIDGNTGDVYQLLPWNHRGWHGGGSSNNTHIGVEMCEPSTIKYTGGASWTETGDGTNTKATVLRTYAAAVELFAMLCKEYGLDPLTQIVSHKEGHSLGIASNHGDPDHLWKKHGLTMDKFRKDVKAAMGGTSTAEEKPTSAGFVLYYIQSGAFSKKVTADALAEDIKAAGFDINVKKMGNSYKVLTDAFPEKTAADAQAKQMKAKGFAAFVTTNGGATASGAAESFKVGDKVKCNAGVTKYSNGARMAAWVPSSVLYVRAVESSGRVLLVSTEPTKPAYTGRVNASDVHKI